MVGGRVFGSWSAGVEQVQGQAVSNLQLHKLVIFQSTFAFAFAKGETVHFLHFDLPLVVTFALYCSFGGFTLFLRFFGSWTGTFSRCPYHHPCPASATSMSCSLPPPPSLVPSSLAPPPSLSWPPCQPQHPGRIPSYISNIIFVMKSLKGVPRGMNDPSPVLAKGWRACLPPFSRSEGLGNRAGRVNVHIAHSHSPPQHLHLNPGFAPRQVSPRPADRATSASHVLPLYCLCPNRHPSPPPLACRCRCSTPTRPFLPVSGTSWFGG